MLEMIEDLQTNYITALSSWQRLPREGRSVKEMGSARGTIKGKECLNQGLSLISSSRRSLPVSAIPSTHSPINKLGKK